MGHVDMALVPWDAEAAADTLAAIRQARAEVEHLIGGRRRRVEAASRHWHGPARKWFDGADGDVQRRARHVLEDLDVLARDLLREQAAVREENRRRRAATEALAVRRAPAVTSGVLP